MATCDVMGAPLCIGMVFLSAAEPVIVLEYMLLGDLRSFLLSKRADRRDEVYVNSKVIAAGLCADDFLHVGLDIARGLEHLSEKKVKNRVEQENMMKG